ncbi:DUF3325 domain-containing protein [Halopseudomonas pelagia]|uniref:DUF3325 domain-containing protein n=1 Tax=Halopseudomonas pelagia TaxID=553151 RepID=UPI00039C7A3E|nr:DUF3325 domain-containing protein [Halopseudomonas pelagia]|tara:strand:- start:52771 stop:53607 length:837 start_codon:yes stop_codon:yes gene_type:complete
MTWMSLSVFTTSLAGFVALALAMPKHSKHLISKALPDSRRFLLRILGWCLLAVALGLAIAQWQFAMGSVVWFGWLSVAGLGLVFYLPKWPWQPQTRPSSPRREKLRNGDAVAAPPAIRSRRATLLRAGFTAAALLLPLSAFTWQLLGAPQAPLLREDAIHGQIGPWAFSLAEKDQKPPEIVAMGVPLKAFVIRFCEGCDQDIRTAYLKVRKPRSLRAAGTSFDGRGREKTAIISLPDAISLNDGIWLTVESKNGEVHYQQFDIQRVSPAIASFLLARP